MSNWAYIYIAAHDVACIAGAVYLIATGAHWGWPAAMLALAASTTVSTSTKSTEVSK